MLYFVIVRGEICFENGFGCQSEMIHRNVTRNLHRVLSSMSTRFANEPTSSDAIALEVLHSCNDFIVIDKPCDLRMDGEFPVTGNEMY